MRITRPAARAPLRTARRMRPRSRAGRPPEVVAASVRRRTFLASLPAAAAASAAVAGASGGATPMKDAGLGRADIHSGDRITGESFASRSTVYGTHGAAATAHPLASLTAIDVLRRGGSAVDAAIAANAALGFLEPVSCGIGGDCFAMVWDPGQHKLLGLNGSGRSPRSLSLA